MKKPLKNRNAIRTLAIYLFMISLSGLLVACETNQPSQTGVVASSTRIVKPTIQLFPTSIPIEAGWQEVVHLGIEKNVMASGGAFTSIHPYRVLVVCEGKGSLKIDFASQGSTTFICRTDAVLQNVDMSSPPKVEQVNVSVIPQGSIAWIASVQMRK